MIDPTLFAAPTAIDRVQHRSQRLKPQGVRFDRTAGMNALFIAAVEFIDASRDYPIVFIEAGQGDDGQREVAPVAVLGLQQGENLVLGSDGSWAARYVPALLRGYPFGMARAGAQGSYVVVIDERADALSATEGEPLFDDKGEPTPMLEERRKFLEQLETEAQRTRLFGRSLLELDLLQPMRFDATLPDGRALTVDGFLTVDEKRLAALPVDKLAPLHQNGILALIFAHQFSLPLMRGLVERRVAREPKTA
jgi:SapC